VAYGNATGGVIEGFVNITSRAAGDGEHWTGQVARSKGTTVPELAYITTELRRPAVDSYPSPNPSPNPGPNPDPNPNPRPNLRPNPDPNPNPDH